MKSLRLWILALALTSFGAGVASGTLVSASLHRAPRGSGPFADYEDRLVRAYDLAPERARLLHALLASYQRELEQVKDRHMAEYMTAMEPELSERGRFYRDLVRDKILPAGRRAEFDAAVSSWIPIR